jgi:viroplasmin and RNaseH domain-containing protein
MGKQVVASILEAFDSRDSLEEAEKQLRSAEKVTEKIRRDYNECYQRSERAQKPLSQFLNALTTGKVAA